MNILSDMEQCARANGIWEREKECQVEVETQTPIIGFQDRDHIERTSFVTIDTQCHMR
jgi:hypothetical protein